MQYAGRTSADRLVDQFLSNTQFTKNRDEVYGERKPFRGTLRGELGSIIRGQISSLINFFTLKILGAAQF